MTNTPDAPLSATPPVDVEALSVWRDDLNGNYAAIAYLHTYRMKGADLRAKADLLATAIEEIKRLRASSVKAAVDDGALREALKAAKRLCDEALPRFNWGGSALDANSIRLLNEVPLLINAALAKEQS